MIPAADAGHTWNIQQIHQESQNASISVYLTFSYVYQSLVLLEKGKPDEANSLWKQKVLPNIRKARSIYEKSITKLSKKPRDLVRGIPAKAQPMILSDLGQYSKPFPTSIRDLARVAEIELKELEASFAKINFGKEKIRNLILIRKINYRISRFISLGISFSTISIWNK